MGSGYEFASDPVVKTAQHSSGSMRVLLLGPDLNAQRGGGLSEVERLLLGAADARIEFSFISTYTDGSRWDQIRQFVRSLVSLVRCLRTQRYDVVHIHFSIRGSALRKSICAWIAQQYRVPVVLHSHGAEFHKFYEELPYVLQRGLKSVLLRAQAIAVLSKSWRDIFCDLVGVPSERIHILPNPVSLPECLPDRRNKGQLRIISVGTLGHRKGTYDLIQAMAEVTRRVQVSVQLRLAGNGDLEGAEALVHSLGLSQTIELCGWIKGEARESVYKQADIFVLPSYNEGVPMAMLEAMAWALPVIVTPVGGIPELISSGHNGILVPSGNQSQLAKAIIELLESEPLRERLGAAARASVERLDLSSYVDQLYQLYLNVARPETGPPVIRRCAKEVQ